MTIDTADLALGGVLALTVLTALARGRYRAASGMPPRLDEVGEASKSPGAIAPALLRGAAGQGRSILRRSTDRRAEPWRRTTLVLSIATVVAFLVMVVLRVT